MDETHRHSGFPGQSALGFASNNHSTTTPDGSKHSGRISAPSPSTETPRALDPQVNPQARQQTAAATLFERLNELVKLRAALAHDDGSFATYHSCAQIIYYFTAGRTVWEYFSDEARATLKFGWETQILEAKGSEESGEALKHYYAYLLQLQGELCNQTVPPATEACVHADNVKGRLFEDLLVVAATGNPNNTGFPVELREDLRGLLDTATNDDLIDVLCLSRIVHSTQPLFIRTMEGCSKRLVELSVHPIYHRTINLHSHLLPSCLSFTHPYIIARAAIIHKGEKTWPVHSTRRFVHSLSEDNDEQLTQHRQLSIFSLRQSQDYTARTPDPLSPALDLHSSPKALNIDLTSFRSPLVAPTLYVLYQRAEANASLLTVATEPLSTVNYTSSPDFREQFMALFNVQNLTEMLSEDNTELFGDDLPRDTSFQDILDAEFAIGEEDAAKERVLLADYVIERPTKHVVPRVAAEETFPAEQSNGVIVLFSDDDSYSVVTRLGRSRGRYSQLIDEQPASKKRRLGKPTESSDEASLEAVPDRELLQPQEAAAAGRPQQAPPAIAQAQPSQAVQTAALPVGLLVPANKDSVPDTAKMVWTYERKFIVDLVCNASLLISRNKADQERLFSAVLQQELTQPGFKHSFPFNKIRSRYGMKDRVGRAGDLEWTDPDWDRIKADQGDAVDKAWRAVARASVHATAQSLRIDLA